MPTAPDPLKDVRIAAPCAASWERMPGDDRVRHCGSCDLNVYDFAEMTEGEVRALLERAGGRLCARLYRRADGTLLTKDCPTGLRALRRRVSRISAAAVAALLSVAPASFARIAFGRPRVVSHGSPVVLTVVESSSGETVFGGVVTGEDSTVPIPGVTITLRDERTGATVTATTDERGAFLISTLQHGEYHVSVAVNGLQPATIEHLTLGGGETIRARVSLRHLVMGEVITIASASVDRSTVTVSTTFTQNFVDKLPH